MMYFLLKIAIKVSMIGTIKTIIGAPKVKKAEALYPNPNKEITENHETYI